jgi:hypothetical protein
MSVETYGWLVLAFPLAGAVLIGLTYWPPSAPSWTSTSSRSWPSAGTTR